MNNISVIMGALLVIALSLSACRGPDCEVKCNGNDCSCAKDEKDCEKMDDDAADLPKDATGIDAV